MSKAGDAAFDAARAQVMRAHTYKTDQETLMAECACGEKVAVHDVGIHIEQEANRAGRAARDEVESAEAS